MGNEVSTGRRIEGKIENILPSLHSGEDEGWTDKKFKPFSGDKDRQQFVCRCSACPHYAGLRLITFHEDAIITVITNNGQVPLNEHQFRLLYSRTENDDVKARIVAVKGGTQRIEAKIESSAGGANQMEAFKLLRAEVEMKLERILSAVPTGVDGIPQPPPPPHRTASIPRRAVGSSALDALRTPSEAPPAYGSSSSSTKKRM